MFLREPQLPKNNRKNNRVAMQVPVATVVALLCLAQPTTPTTAGADGDLAIVWQRRVASLLPGAGSADAKAAVALATELASQMDPANCSWADIDYHEFRRAGWPMEAHLARSLDIAVGYRLLVPGDPPSASHRGRRSINQGAVGDDRKKGAGSLLTASRCSLGFWLANDYLDPNWFDNMITTPQQAGSIALLLHGELARSTTAKVNMVMRRAVWQGCPDAAGPKCGSPAEHYQPWTGANLVCEATCPATPRHATPRPTPPPSTACPHTCVTAHARVPSMHAWGSTSALAAL